MIDEDRLPAGLVSHPALRGTLTRLTTRSYGTVIYRAGGCYVKLISTRDLDDLRFHPLEEAERLDWLGRHGLPVPEVVDAGADETTMWLVTAAVPGKPAAADWSPEELPAVVDAVADLARALHELPIGECPFDRTLASTLPLARRAVELGRVDLEDLDYEHQGWTPQRLLAELDATPAPGEEDLVVCHGDLCLDNIVIAPDTLTVTGILDAGRLGRADRWVDLAIATRNIAEECAEWGYRPDHAERFLRRYGVEADSAKNRFYRLMDEFV